MGSIVLSPDEQALAGATMDAIRAAGGLEICARETGKSKSQLQRCQSAYHADSLSSRDAAIIDRLTHGHPGHPYILRAQARRLGCLVIEMPVADEDHDHLLSSVAELTASLGDTARSIYEAAHPDSDGGAEITPKEAARILADLEEHDRRSAQLRQKLERLAKAGRK